MCTGDRGVRCLAVGFLTRVMLSTVVGIAICGLGGSPRRSALRRTAAREGYLVLLGLLVLAQRL